MRTSLLAVVGLLAGSFVVGCAAEPAEDGADTAAGAATASTKLASGVYDTELSIAVKGTAIEGSYFAQIGDPAQGGATCSFTVAGWIENVGGVEHGHVTVTDGWSATGGEIIAQPNGGVFLKLQSFPNACMRTSPMLDQGFTLDTKAPLAAGVVGFRSVKADKAFFYDRAGGNPRAAYVLSGDTLQVTGAEQNGFLPVQYVGNTATTKGFIKSSDIMATMAPVPKDTLRASYEIEANDAIGAGFEVITSHNRDMFFNLTAVNKFGGMNMGDIQMGHAKLVGDTATWQGDGCKITFAFSSDAKKVTVDQDAPCSDFGHNVHVSGTYLRK